MSIQWEEWFGQAEYDFGTAQAMVRARRYIYSIFMCHLCLEKILKGLLSKRDIVPPKSHDLVYLLGMISRHIPEKHAEFLEMLNDVSVPTRYPEELSKLLTQYPRKRAVEIVQKTWEAKEWLQLHC
jgi:HEPN domain-containing protein